MRPPLNAALIDCISIVALWSESDNIVALSIIKAAHSSLQGSHGHEISGKVLKLENQISSTGNVLE